MLELITRARAIMMAPQAEWPAIAGESNDSMAVQYVAILSLVPAVARLAGGWLIGGYTPLLPALIGAVVAYALSFVLVLAVALAVDLLAPRFDSRRGYGNALRLTAYSFTPVWLAGIFLLVPGASFLVVLGLYGIYLLWTGIPILMRTPGKKVLPYAAAIAGCAVAFDIVARVLLTMVSNAVR